MSMEPSDRDLAFMEGPAIGDEIFLKRPFCPPLKDQRQVFDAGVIVEVVAEGSLYGVRFGEAPEIFDFSRDSFAAWRSRLSS